MAQQPKLFYEFGSFRLDAGERLLLRDRQPVPLTPKVFDILLALVESSGHILEKEDLMKRVWSDQFVEEGNLTRNVSTLRKALGENSIHPRYIETIPWRGYRFIADVREVAVGSADLVVREQSRSRQIFEGEQETDSRRGRVLLVCGMLVILIAAAAWGWFRWRQRRGLQAAEIHSIAVLPFANLSGDPSQEFFADGMTDELITDLAKIQALRVISRTSVMHYKGLDKTAREIAKELGVQAIVEGTFVRSASKIRITAQLIEAQGDRHLWAESYNRDLQDVLGLQSEVARTIADRIKITVTPEEMLRLSPTQTVNPEAHELYLKGTFYNNKWTKEGFERGIEYFNQALQIEPGNARAYSGLAVSYGGLGIYGDISGYPRQKTAALQALQIDDTLAEAHNTLAWAKFTYDWDPVGAEQEFRRAIELNPSDATTHAWYGIFLAMRGRIEDSSQQVRITRELDPLSLANAMLAYRTYCNSRDYDKAIEVLHNILDMDPNFVPAHQRLAAVYELEGELDKAIEERQQSWNLVGEASLELAREINSLRKAYAEKGARGYWHQRLKWVIADAHRADGNFPIALVVVHARLGNKDEAFRLLDEALKDHVPYLIWSLPAGPEMDDLRSDPRYADLLRRLVPRSE